MPTRISLARLLAALLTFALLAAACSDDDDATTTTTAPANTDEVESDDDEDDEDDEVEQDDALDASGAGGIDLSLTRDDYPCTEEDLGADDTTEFVNAHYVVDGTLGALCFGEEDSTLIQAWEELSTITPSLQLADLALFAGFVATGDGDEVTLAFVNSLDDDGAQFQMSVNLDSYDEDPNEASLTMAHEFAHVFTGLSTQIDRSADPAECSTFWNGEGCYYPDSIMAQWIAMFWGDGLIDEIDPDAEASGSAGEERCSSNPSFFGPYAASSPEEDFAESFSAFVYRLDTETPAQQAKIDWIEAQAGLLEFRDRADAAELGPLENNFESCGV